MLCNKYPQLPLCKIPIDDNIYTLYGGDTQDIIKYYLNLISLSTNVAESVLYGIKFRDINSDWFEEVESEISIPAYQSTNLIFEAIQISGENTNIILSIWPTRHLYSRKDLEFTAISSSILGDINGDQNLNVLDVILVVNMALGNSGIDLNGDMNGDGMINVLDVVLLVNIILEN